MLSQAGIVFAETDETVCIIFGVFFTSETSLANSLSVAGTFRKGSSLTVVWNPFLIAAAPFAMTASMGP